MDLEFTVGLADLNDWPAVDKQPAEFSCFRQVTAAVLPQIHDDAADALGFEFHDQPRHIPRRARVVRFA